MSKNTIERCQACYALVDECSCEVGRTMTNVLCCSDCGCEIEEPTVWGGDICLCNELDPSIENTYSS